MGRTGLSIVAFLALAACGDPLRDVTRLSDVDVAPQSATIAEAPSEAAPQQGGLFARLLNRSPEDPSNAAVEAALADAGVGEAETAQATAPVAVAAAPARERGGLFGLFRANRSAPAAQPEAPSAEAAADLTVADVASSDAPGTQTDQVIPAAAPVPAPPAQEDRRGGLLGLFANRQDRNAPEIYEGPDAQIVPLGTLVPFGTVARVCDFPRNPGGRQVDQFDGLRLIDAIPNSTASRPHYLTGFDDGCARTFAGAVVITGTVEAHEFVRYQPSNERIAYTAVDNAYEALKQRICRVGRGQPCGARTDRLENSTQFLSVYGSFGGSNGRWMQILVHDGRVLAVSVKEG